MTVSFRHAMNSSVRLVLVLLVVVGMGCFAGCAGDSVAGPYCGVFTEDEVTDILGVVDRVDEYSVNPMRCRVYGENGVLVARVTDDSWVEFGRDGDNAVTTMEAITGGEGRQIPGSNARVFSFMVDSDSKYKDAYGYWLEGRAGFAVYVVATEGVDDSTVAALEELVIKYAPQVLDGVASRTEDPGPNWNDPATSAPSGEPSAAQTAESSREAESTSTAWDCPGSATLTLTVFAPAAFTMVCAWAGDTAGTVALTRIWFRIGAGQPSIAASRALASHWIVAGGSYSGKGQNSPQPAGP